MLQVPENGRSGVGGSPHKHHCAPAKSQRPLCQTVGITSAFSSSAAPLQRSEMSHGEPEISAHSGSIYTRELRCVRLFGPHRLEPARLLCPWDSPGKHTGAGCHARLQGTFPTRASNLCLLHWQVDPFLLCPSRWQRLQLRVSASRELTVRHSQGNHSSEGEWKEARPF